MLETLDLSRTNIISLPVGDNLSVRSICHVDASERLTCVAGVWQLPLTKFDVGYCKELDVNATMGMIVQSFPGLTELGLRGLRMEALPEGVILKRDA